jgi:hypothetical protein
MKKVTNPKVVPLSCLEPGHVYSCLESKLFLSQIPVTIDLAGWVTQRDMFTVITEPKVVPWKHKDYEKTTNYWVVQVLTSTQVLGWIRFPDDRWIGDLYFKRVTPPL